MFVRVAITGMFKKIMSIILILALKKERSKTWNKWFLYSGDIFCSWRSFMMEMETD